jgi:hypothetical protein
VAEGKQFGWLDPPRRSPLAAIAWKQLRESGPIALAGLAGIVGIAALFVAIEPREVVAKEDLIELIALITMTFGFAIAMVIGVGVSHSDMTPKVNAFWRSRPINPDLWFWTKALTALAVLVVVLYVPFMALVSQSNRIGVNTLDGRIVVLVHLAVFAAAMAMSCLVRHAVYARRVAGRSSGKSTRLDRSFAG